MTAKNDSTKPKYEKPAFILLGELARGQESCNPGTGAAEGCTNGHNAIGLCFPGYDASFGCNPGHEGGTDPEADCTPGFVAGGACGPGTTPAG